jgi:hypothetical protein
MAMKKHATIEDVVFYVAIARQRHSKHVSTATNECAIVGEPLEVVSFAWSISSHYLTMTSGQTEDFICAVVIVICSVCALVRLLWLFVLTPYKHTLNPVIIRNPVYIDKLMTIF